VFTTLLTDFKQQGKIEETQIEGLIGLELLRHDIEHAGFGLPWNLDGADYEEASISPVEGKTPYNDRLLSDGPPNNPVRGDDVAGASNPPGGIRSADDDDDEMNGFNDSDMLVIKSMNVARNGASQRWTRLGEVDLVDHPEGEKRNGLSGDDFENSDRVIVISVGITDETRRTLMKSNDDNSIYTAYNATEPFAPFDEEVFLIYGVKPFDDGIEPQMPFNRADYYIRKPTNMPSKCAIHDNIQMGTGTLYKGQLSHNNGLISFELPLLDCVADMQIVYRINTGAGAADTYVNAFYVNTLSAAQIRAQVREVRVYILAQEGQREVGYTFSNTGTQNCPDCAPALCDTCILVGEDDLDPVGCDGNSYCGSEFNLAARIDDWDEYRWKVYTMVVTPINLRR
jgi:hypothetical protein